MRYEVRKSGGAVCQTCGATDLVVTAHTAEDLVHDVTETMAAIQPARWRLLARRRATHLSRIHAEAVERLRKLTYLV
jgi:hypothetical protein